MDYVRGLQRFRLANISAIANENNNNGSLEKKKTTLNIRKQNKYDKCTAFGIFYVCSGWSDRTSLVRFCVYAKILNRSTFKNINIYVFYYKPTNCKILLRLFHAFYAANNKISFFFSWNRTCQVREREWERKRRKRQKDKERERER